MFPFPRPQSAMSFLPPRALWAGRNWILRSFSTFWPACREFRNESPEMTTVPQSKVVSQGVDLWLRMYRQMVAIREFETQVNELYTRALMPGLAHLYIGEEAVAAGVCAALTHIAWPKARLPIECSPNCWARRRGTAKARVVPCTLRTRRPATWEQMPSWAAA